MDTVMTYLNSASWQDLFIVGVPYMLSAITVYTMFLAGNKDRKTWAIGLFNQFFWLLWILVSGNFGFLPMNVALWIVYCINLRKWQANRNEDDDILPIQEWRLDERTRAIAQFWRNHALDATIDIAIRYDCDPMMISDIRAMKK